MPEFTPDLLRLGVISHAVNELAKDMGARIEALQTQVDIALTEAAGPFPDSAASDAFWQAFYEQVDEAVSAVS